MNEYIKSILKDLNDDNLHTKVGDVLGTITGNQVSSNQTQLMFAFYNRIFKDKPEYTQSCSACRLRVYNRLTHWHKENIKEE